MRSDRIDSLNKFHIVGNSRLNICLNYILPYGCWATNISAILIYGYWTESRSFVIHDFGVKVYYKDQYTVPHLSNIMRNHAVFNHRRNLVMLKCKEQGLKLPYECTTQALRKHMQPHACSICLHAIQGRPAYKDRNTNVLVDISNALPYQYIFLDFIGPFSPPSTGNIYISVCW